MMIDEFGYKLSSRILALLNCWGGLRGDSHSSNSELLGELAVSPDKIARGPDFLPDYAQSRLKREIGLGATAKEKNNQQNWNRDSKKPEQDVAGCGCGSDFIA
jgi:hypothetical protein